MSSHVATNSETHSTVDAIGVITNPTASRVNVEPGSTSDNVVRMVVQKRSATETHSISDTPSRHATHIRTPTETHIVTDATGRIYNRIAPVVEILTLVEVTTVSQGFKPRITVETLTPTQTVTRRYHASRNPIDAVGAVSYLFPSNSLLPNSTLYPGTIGAIDNLSVRYNAKRYLTESLVTNDTLRIHLIRGRRFVETYVATDALLHHYTAVRSPVETHTASDAVLHHDTAHRALRETLVPSQVATRHHGALRSSIETFTAVQVLTTRRLETRSIIEGVLYLYPSNSIFPSNTLFPEMAITNASDVLSSTVHHNHAQFIYEYLTTTDEPFLHFLLPVEGYINYDAATDLTTSDLPDWGYVLIEGASNALYWAPLARFEVDPYREK